MINDNNSRVLFGPINLIEYERIVGNKCFSLAKCHQAPNLPSGILDDFLKMTQLGLVVRDSCAKRLVLWLIGSERID